MRAVVIGHVEWIDFIRVEALPQPGEIIHAADSWQEPGGGGSVAAVQLAKLAGAASFFTALGNDDLGRRARSGLSALGPNVEAVFRHEPQRRALTFIDDSGERTITVMGERIAPVAADPLPWSELEGADVVFLTAGDPELVRMARSARVLVATSRILPVLTLAGVELDAVVGSDRDPSERYRRGDIDPEPRLVVKTAGERGGTFEADGGPVRNFDPAPLPGPVVDSYGCGDSFAAGLAYGLGLGYSPDKAVELAARCGAAALTGRGPYQGQLRSN